MRRPEPLPEPIAARQSFAVVDALELGATRRRLEASDLRIPFRGARLDADAPATVASLAAAYATRMPQTQFFSHSTAAILNGVPLPLHVESDLRLHVSVLAGDPQPRVRNVIGHQLDPRRTGTLVAGGIRVTDAATTWCQLATLLGVDDLIAAGDFLITGREKLGGGPRVASVATLTAAAARHHRGVGAGRLREALPTCVPDRCHAGRRCSVSVSSKRGCLNPWSAIGFATRGSRPTSRRSISRIPISASPWNTRATITAFPSSSAATSLDTNGCRTSAGSWSG